MEKKFKIALATTGILTAAMVSFIPLTSYAAEDDFQTNTKSEITIGENKPTADSTVYVRVAPVISLEVTVDGNLEDDKTMSFTLAPNTIDSANFTAKVTSTQKYTLSVHADNKCDESADYNASQGCNKTTMYHTDDVVGSTIKGIAGDGKIVKGNSSWGIKLADATDYSEIPSVATPFYTSDGPASQETKFTIGIAAGTDLIAGAYSNTLYVTATAN